MRGDRSNVGGGAEEGPHVVAERSGEGLVDALSEGGLRLAGRVEDEVAAGAEGGDVLEAEGLEAGGELVAAGAAAADVDGAEEGDVAGHARIVVRAPRGGHCSQRRLVRAGLAQGRGGRRACRGG
jgi:hypothetical protein